MNNILFTTDKYKAEFCDGGNIPVYIALLSDGTQNNIELPDDIYKEFDGLGQGTKTLKTYFSKFEICEKTDVMITMPENVKEISVKPECAKVNYSFNDGYFVFTAEDDCNFYIEPDGDVFGGIHVICNRKKEIIKDKENVIEFTDGIYTADNCEHIRKNEHGIPVIDNIKDNTLIYIDEKAVVNAAIVLKGVKNVKIAGSGMISLIDRCHGAENSFSDERMWGAFRYYALPNIYIRSGCENIEIEDVLLNCEFRGVVIRNSKKISLKNIKMFTSTENADGINCYNTSDLLVDSCYIQSADDCFCMYNSCDSIPTLFDEGYNNVKAVCRNVEVKNCIMSSNARPVVLGGHATGSTNPRCVIENIYIHDCEIMETPYRIFGNTKEYSMYWSGFLRILSQSHQIVRNLKFENIDVNVTKGHNGKIFHIEVREKNQASYTECEGYKIENLTFRNINIKGSTEKLLPSLIRCRNGLSNDDVPKIENITFDNINCTKKNFDMDSIIIEGPVQCVNVVK